MSEPPAATQPSLPLEDLLQQIEAAIAANLYYVALMVTLTLPDICAALEQPDGQTNQARYADWVDRNLPPGASAVPLSGSDIRAFRNGVLHQGTLETHPGRPYSRLLFLEPGGRSILAHMNVFGDALNIDVRLFCARMIHFVRLWRTQVESTPAFRQNYERFMQRRLANLPVIGPAVIIG